MLQDPVLNKGSAFTEEERRQLGLVGLIPAAVESIEQQLARVERQYSTWTNDLDRHIYLRQLQDTNETLFARFVRDHVEETLPVVYTPTVGDACMRFSEMYRRSRGMFVSYPNRERLDETLACGPSEVDVIVVTDGERILGLGDQGAGGMGIPIGKLSLYSVFGGIDPARALPVVLDVGTNNAERLADPGYLGWRNERITGDDYLGFVDAFVGAVRRRYPNALLQWEDFAQQHATILLDRHRESIASFNDDIQGTAAVALAAIWSAVRTNGGRLDDQVFCIYGAGSAGTGIAGMIVQALDDAGVPDPAAAIYMLDSKGLITDRRAEVKPHQRPFVQPFDRVAGWADGGLDLGAVVRNIGPTVLVGVSGQPSSFTEAMLKDMMRATSTPIVLPLSNPTSRSEATPTEILRWTEGQAIVATGSPFPDVALGGRVHRISQANNVYVFPGVGLGVVLGRATGVSDRMLMSAARAVADHHTDTESGVLPELSAVPELSLTIARAVAETAVADGHAPSFTDEEWTERVDYHRWTPDYAVVRRD